MVVLSFRQMPYESAEPRIVTDAAEATSQEFDHLVVWHRATPTITHIPAGTVIFSEAGTFDPSKLKWPQFLVQATAALSWHVQGQVSVADACDDFADLLHDVVEVETVVSFEDEGVVHIWTYLDAGPFETAIRYRIYDAADEILNRYPQVEIDFHLINLTEYPTELWEGLRQPGTVVYERDSHASQKPASTAGD